jgi:drug/metabolite transporter (DMT)-like permease
MMSKDYIKLHCIIFVWGFTAIIGALLSISSLDLVFYRTFFATLIVLTIARITKRSLIAERRAMIQIVLSGFLLSAHWITFFAAVNIAGVSITLAGLSTATFFTALISPLISDHKLSKKELLLGVMVISGLYMVYNFQADSLMGILVALSSAVFVAVYTIMSGTFMKTHHQLVIGFYQLGGACIATLFFIPLFQVTIDSEAVFQHMPTVRDAGLLLILTLLCTVYPIIATLELMKRMSVFVVSLSINMEPIYGMILAALLLDEHKTLNGGFYWGALTIIGAIFLYPMLTYRESLKLMNQ